MAPDLRGRRIALLGGDRRELELARTLAQAGALVRVAGFPLLPELSGCLQVSDPRAAVEGAEAIIAPISGTDSEGRIRVVLDRSCEIVLDDDLLAGLQEGTLLLIGSARPCVRAAAERHRLKLVETAEIDEIAILNSIPTAEGAIQIAMEELPITIWGSRSAVLGFGRCGMTLARLLKGLGAKTTVVARDPAQRARAEEMGCEVASFRDLAGVLARQEIIFNTVPALVLTREVLAALDREVLVIDLASPPGGVDYDAARELGIDAILASGLPGKVAPKTAGQILARTLPPLIADLLPSLSSEEVPL